MSKFNIMIDLETLGVNKLPVITSIGWAIFDKNNIINSGCLNPRLEKAGTIDGDAVLWWLEQSEYARKSITDPERIETLKDCLMRLGGMISESQFKGVWANGVSFDLRILEEWYDYFGCEKPWSFRQERCLRSFRDLDIRLNNNTENKHSAEHDAIAQAQAVINVWRAYVKLG